MNTPWRRRRREVLGRSRRQGADASFITAVLALVAGALLTVTAGFWAMQELEQFGPTVGGIIVFKADAAATERWSVRAALVEQVGNGVPFDTARHCTLSPSIMADRGGSLVIEARRMSRPPVFSVHWAGGHTGTGAADCGTIADLVLERTELMRLANVAGGFSSGLRLIGP